MNVSVLERSYIVQWAAGWIASMIGRRACSGGESSLIVVALSWWKRYFEALMSLIDVCMAKVLNVL